MTSSNKKELNEKIDNGEFTIYDKFLYGGIGYGYICLSTNIFKVLMSLIFPPFGIIIHHLQLEDTYPYITKDGLANLVANLGDVALSIFLTFLFWIPGVIYSFQKMKVFGMEHQSDKEKFIDNYGFSPDKLDNEMIKDIMKKKIAKGKFNL